jgi:hypothetical protein
LRGKDRERQVEPDLPPDLAVLFNAMRSEFDAKLSYSLSKMTNKILLLGVPLGAVGGFVAEMAKPGIARASGTAIAAFLGF